MTKKQLFSIVIVLLLWDSAHAQIYSQGKNLNDQRIFFLKVALVKTQLNPERYLAQVDFYGKKKDLEMYLTNDLVHKSFNDISDLIAYMENNGWYFLKKEEIKSKLNEVIHEQYSFRKSMNNLKGNDDDKVSILDDKN